MDNRYDLITKDLEEIIGDDVLRTSLEEKNPIIYWGTAPTGRIHIGYLKPLLKIVELVKANCKVIILLADLHAILDSLKSSFDQIEFRTQYYKLIIEQLLISLGLSEHDINSKIEFIRGTEFQLAKQYSLDVYKANSFISIKKALHAGTQVVKQSENPMVNSLLYPTLQSLDMVYLKADGFLGGVDQRKINVHTNEILPKLGYEDKKFFLMNKMIPGLSSSKNDDGDNKMSSSDTNGKLDLLDEPDIIRSKIKKAYCLPGDVTDNSLLVLCKEVIFPILSIKESKFTIVRKEKFGGDYEVNNYDELENKFLTKDLHPEDLKNSISHFLITFLENTRRFFSREEMKNLLEEI